MKQMFPPLRRYLQNILLNLLLVWLHLVRPYQDRHAALVIPPADPGSAGDEAMMIATVSYLRHHGFTRIGLISYGTPLSWDSHLAVEETLNLRAFFNTASGLDELRFSRMAARYGQVYGLGADVMDGYYSPRDTQLRLRLLTLAARTGAPSRLLGFSFNAAPAPETVKAFQALPANIKLCTRDPLSQRRLAGHLGRPVRLVADLAFLLEPAPFHDLPQAVLHWLEEERKTGRIVVAINANYLAFKDYANPADVITRFVEALTQVYEGNLPVSFLLIPHDMREPHSDVSMAANIHAQLPPPVRAHSLAVTAALPAAQIKALCSKLDFAVSSRMHLAIACLGQGTPVACITYQGKFEGLFEHFHLDGMLMDAKAVLEPDALSAFLTTTLNQRDAARIAITASWPQVRHLAESNFTD